MKNIIKKSIMLLGLTAVLSSGVYAGNVGKSFEAMINNKDVQMLTGGGMNAPLDMWYGIGNIVTRLGNL